MSDFNFLFLLTFIFYSFYNQDTFILQEMWSYFKNKITVQNHMWTTYSNFICGLEKHYPWDVTFVLLLSVPRCFKKWIMGSSQPIELWPESLFTLS